MHVYHYAHYEVGVLQRLAGEYGTREEHVDELLRREVFVDLYRVVAQSLRISHPRYWLKQVETFFMPERTEEVSAGDDSIVVFEQWLDTGDDALLEAIERYNEVDCRSTEQLREWLLERRAEAGIETWKELEAPREITEEKAEAIAEREAAAPGAARRRRGGRRALAARRSCSSTTAARRGRSGGTTSAGSRRPRRSCSTDSESIGGLELVGEPEAAKQSRVYTLTLPDRSSTSSSAGDGVVDPATDKAARRSSSSTRSTARCGSRAATKRAASRCRAR